MQMRILGQFDVLTEAFLNCSLVPHLQLIQKFLAHEDAMVTQLVHGELRMQNSSRNTVPWNIENGE